MFMIGRKSVNMKAAKVNQAKFRRYNPIKEGRILSIDNTVGRIIQKNELYKSIFVGNAGKYACTSSMKEGFKSNPFGINIKAVANISTKFNEIMESMGCCLSGWNIYNSGNGFYTISWSACDEDLYELDSSKLVYDVQTGKVSELGKAFFGESIEPFETIEENLPKILVSLRNVSMPIDLFEVCIADNFMSEEGSNFTQGGVISYLMSEDIGNVHNESHILSGVSLISDQNEFTQYPFLDGKYALIVVQ